ncbi:MULTISPECIES: class I SAM-dependent methyltransferase [Paenibacillus]|uniref:Methyltransferase n=1 Tax=Paenibacillus odorifer TaxID=189426 RepID=A0A1R0XDU8_9BACL|nr:MULTISPECIES: class I SAM-dependent methyltransferase [Paenibacillus]ETT45377.1 putative methyltransferase [Paenibacillus sp. FSL H8-237]MEC0130901.1 methyltransferase domain-containing protein [Paenibacillus odorifer]MEC0221104.1 methyltransferase domain-containing protein [Paenibacillus odorifer]OMD00285.1 methyltransferase [Paenibacillus odorifer]OMD01821.1 methyltransferase [Paenibacillus odorifer]
MNDYGPDLFKDTASYYTRYRPLYPSSLIRYLVNKFSLNGEGRLLDLGCGTGQLAQRFTDWFEKIVGVDTELEMLEEAKLLSKYNRVENVSWQQGRAEELSNDWGSFRLIMMAKAFHWMDRESILEILYHSLDDNGGIAVIDTFNEQQEPLPWQQKVDEVVKRWLGDERIAGNSTYRHPQERHEDVVKRSSFTDVERQVLSSYSITWTVDSILGNLYSTSYASKRLFRDNLERFEDDMKSALLEIEPTGIFTEELSVSIITAFKKEADLR